MTLPYLGVGDYLVDYDRIAINERLLLSDVKNPTTGLPRYEGFQAIPGFGDLAAKTIPEFRCPSDHLEPCNELRSVFGALQVCWREGVPDRMLTFRPLLEDPSGEFGLTNYAGCTGSHFGGFVPGDDEGNAGRGMMTYRRGLPMSKIIDGLSNTVMLGETIGQVQAGKRLGAQNWLVGGLAKGGKNLDTPYPALGRINNAYWTGFSSVHAGGVWLSFGDCHVELFNRQTDEVTLESLCGIADARNSN